MKDITPTLKEAFPFLPDEKLEEVEARLDQHITIVMDMYERISNDPVEYKKLKVVLARRKAWNQSDSPCRCIYCQEKFERAYDSLQSDS